MAKRSKTKINVKPFISALVVGGVVGLAFYLGTQMNAPKKPAVAPVKKPAATVKKPVVAVKPKPKPAVTPKVTPPVVPAKKTEPVKKAKVAIVMDDFGYNTTYLNDVYDIGLPITISILPNLPYSDLVAESADEHGYEAILHMPMESDVEGAPEESDTVRASMSEQEIGRLVADQLATVPGVRGVSNHMGSLSTENRAFMSIIMKELKKRNLYFLDSLTAKSSVCKEVAAERGVKYARRDFSFIDNSSLEASIEKELTKMKESALKKGSVIALCHYRKNTIKVLKRMMPEMSGAGIDFVYASELAH